MPRFEVWKTLEFQRLGCGFEMISEKLHADGHAFYGATAPISCCKYPVSPKGGATLVLVTKTDLQFVPDDEYSYVEFLRRGQTLGLKLCRPAVAPQWVYSDITEPTNEMFLLACAPEHIGWNSDEGSFVALGMGHGAFNFKKATRYIEAVLLEDPECILRLDSEQRWVFEVV